MRVVADAVLEDDLGIFDVGDVLAGVATDDDEVGVFSGRDRADGLLAAEIDGSVEGGDVNGFDGAEAAATRSSISRWSPKPGRTPPSPVGSGPARRLPPAATNSRSSAMPFAIAGGEISLSRRRGHGGEDARLEMDVGRGAEVVD